MKIKCRLLTPNTFRKQSKQKVYRSNLIQQRINEMINDKTIMIDTAGEEIGQVNGLAVLDMGDFAFRPAEPDYCQPGVRQEKDW